MTKQEAFAREHIPNLVAMGVGFPLACVPLFLMARWGVREGEWMVAVGCGFAAIMCAGMGLVSLYLARMIWREWRRT